MTTFGYAQPFSFRVGMPAAPVKVDRRSPATAGYLDGRGTERATLMSGDEPDWQNRSPFFTRFRFRYAALSRDLCTAPPGESPLTPYGSRKG